jgi:hypothetical protein
VQYDGTLVADNNTGAMYLKALGSFHWIAVIVQDRDILSQD